MGMFLCHTVDAFLSAEEFLASDDEGESWESYMMVEEGSGFWEMMGLGGAN